jgi:hypothetical protein
MRCRHFSGPNFPGVKFSRRTLGLTFARNIFALPTIARSPFYLIDIFPDYMWSEQMSLRENTSEQISPGKMS